MPVLHTSLCVVGGVGAQPLTHVGKCVPVDDSRWFAGVVEGEGALDSVGQLGAVEGVVVPARTRNME